MKLVFFWLWLRDFGWNAEIKGFLLIQGKFLINLINACRFVIWLLNCSSCLSNFEAIDISLLQWFLNFFESWHTKPKFKNFATHQSVFLQTNWKGKFWQFWKENFDSFERKILTVWKGKFWQFGKGIIWQFWKENFDSLEKENFDSLKRKILTVWKGKFWQFGKEKFEGFRDTVKSWWHSLGITGLLLIIEWEVREIFDGKLP